MKLLPLQILYEDEVLLVCNKPEGLMVEPDRNNHPNLLEYVKNYLKQTTENKQPYVQHLHRLDRVTSGIVLFTKQKEYLRDLSEQFAQRNVSKKYLALTVNAPSKSEALLEHWHRKEKKRAVLYEGNIEFTELAKLHYTVSPYHQYFLWDITLFTGKYHQIRAQLASLNCPILGDELYGSITPYASNAIALHATQLSVTHPITQQLITFTAPCSFCE